MKGTDLMQALGEVPEEYIARALEDAPSQNRTAFLVSKPFLAGVSTAACLLLIVGVGVGVWSRQQRIEPLPPKETQTTTVTQTESRTETTAQFTTASQTTSRPPETAVCSTTISSRAQPSMSEAALLTRVPGQESTVVTTAAKQTTAAEVAPGTPSDVTHTALPQTSVKPQTTAGTAVQHTPRMTETALPVTTKQDSDSTEPVQSSTKPSTETPETALPTEEQTDTMSTTQLPTEALTEKPTQAPTQSLTESSMPSTEKPTQAPTQHLTESSMPSTESATQAPKPEENYDLLPGFRVVNKGELTTIYCLDPVPAPPPELYYYSLDSERFSIQSVSSKSDYRAQYEIYEAATRSQLQLTQTRRSSFISSFYRNGKLEPQTVGDYSGYWIFDNRGTRLVWDDGKYTFELFGANDDKDLFMPIAEALHITDAVI